MFKSLMMFGSERRASAPRLLFVGAAMLMGCNKASDDPSVTGDTVDYSDVGDVEGDTAVSVDSGDGDTQSEDESPPAFVCEHQVMCWVGLDSPAVEVVTPWEGQAPTIQCTVVPSPPAGATLTWSVSRDGIELGSPSVLREMELTSMGAGEYSIGAHLEASGTECVAGEVRWVVEPPSAGLYFEFDWGGLGNSGLPHDLDLHMVREGRCYNDPEEDVFYGTIGRQMDWGVQGESLDDPVYLWDSTTSPGAEAAWVEEPAPGDVIHLAVFGFKVPAGSDPMARVRVFQNGELKVQNTVEVRDQEWVPVGALAGSVWGPSSIEPEGDDGESPGPCPLR